MIGFITGTLLGLVIGWSILPQPDWIKNLFDKAEKKVEDIKK